MIEQIRKSASKRRRIRKVTLRNRSKITKDIGRSLPLGIAHGFPIYAQAKTRLVYMRREEAAVLQVSS